MPEYQTPVTEIPSADSEDLSDLESLRRAFVPRGAARDLMADRSPEIVTFGASGTGKSRASLEKLYAAAQKYPGMRGAIVRKFRSTITQSALNTFDNLVRSPGDGVKFNTVKQEYNFPNGSQIVVAGLDDPTKILSTEFDIVYVQEATEIDEDTWETLTTRLRWNHMPYQQIIGDCNPDSERHWIKRRQKEDKLKLLQSMHKDNPLWWDEKEERWTPAGEQYISKLMAMSGFMRERFYEGKWVGAEGLIYTEYKPERNLITPFKIPNDWERFISIDFGFNFGFVCQWWAKDHDGRLYLYREIYRTQALVEDLAHEIHELSGKEVYKAIICDHDNEDRATLERHMGHSFEECTGGREKDFWKVPTKRIATIGADKDRKSVPTGIQQVQGRLKPAGDGKPRLFFFKNAVVGPDPLLMAAKRPYTTEMEIDSYVWDEIHSGRLGDRVLDQPRKENDHGMDAMRYAVRYVDGKAARPSSNIFGTGKKHSYASGNKNKKSQYESKDSFWKR